MRTLLPPPDAILESGTHAPRVGSFRGSLPPVDLTPLALGPLERLIRHKRWVYVAIASEDVYLGVAVVHLGYIANTFVFVFDRVAGRVLADRSALGLPIGVSISDAAGEGSHAVARLPGARVRIERPRAETLTLVEVELRDVRVFARMDCAGAPPAISAVGLVPGGHVNATEKRALLSVTGEASIAGRRISLDAALGGYDYTNGLLPRSTRWRWGFALGRARSGAQVGLNLVEGMVGEAECALWVGGELFPLAAGRFTFDASRPLDPWRVATEDGAVDLRFAPRGMHEDRTDLGIVRSRFRQPVGTYSGTLRVPGGETLELDGVLGVTEDQDMLW